MECDASNHVSLIHVSRFQCCDSIIVATLLNIPSIATCLHERLGNTHIDTVNV